MTVPDPMSTEITRKMPWPALAEVASGGKGLTLDASCQAYSPIAHTITTITTTPSTPHHELLIPGNPELRNKTSLPSAVSVTHYHLEATPKPINPIDLWIAWAP